MRAIANRVLVMCSLWAAVAVMTACETGPPRAYASSLRVSQTSDGERSPGPFTTSLIMDEVGYLWVEVKNAVAFETTVRIEIYYEGVFAGEDTQTLDANGTVWARFWIVPLVTGSFTFVAIIDGVTGSNDEHDFSVVP